MADVTSEPQRRQVTVLFSDLANSTALSDKLPLEELNSVFQHFLSSCSEVVTKEGGYVARYMGDGLLAYFGYPVGREHAVENAISAALGIRTYVARTPVLADLKVEVRSGIATGNVIVGEELRSGNLVERMIVGDAPNLAARLQGLAAGNEVYVSEQTRLLAQDHIEFHDCGYTSIKGFSEPQKVFSVSGLNARAGTSRPNVRTLREFYGRKTELLRLCEALQVEDNGRGKTVFVTGDAGIGKSRLIEEAVNRLQDQTLIKNRGYCRPQASGLPFALVNQICDFDLLSEIPKADEQFGQSDVAGNMSLLEQYAAKYVSLFCEAYSDQPCIFLLEDLHWADAASLTVLHQLSLRTRHYPWVFVFTSREASLAKEWSVRPEDSVHLQPLSLEETEHLVRASIQDSLPQDFTAKIVERSGGVPLFLNELSLWAMNAQGKTDPQSVPDSLLDLLQARLDAVEGGLPVLQAISVLGDTCHEDLLLGVLGLDQQVLSQCLDDLCAMRVLKRHGASSDIISFSHALLRDAAEQTLLGYQKQSLHRQAADCGPDLGMPGLQLARHWVGCGEDAKAVEHYLRDVSIHKSQASYLTAQALLDEAADALNRIERSAMRDELELKFQSLMASILQITIGYAATRTVEATNRAGRLAERTGAFAQKFEQTVGRWMAASSAGQFNRAAKISDEVLSLAMSQGLTRSLGIAHMAQLTALGRIGDLNGTEEAFRNGKAYFSQDEFRSLPGAISQAYGNAAFFALLRGDISEARHRAAVTLDSGRSKASYYDQAFARYIVALFAVTLGADRMAARLASSALQIARLHQFPQFSSVSQIVFGRAMCGTGQARQGIEEILSGLAAMESTGSTVGKSIYLTWLAEAYIFNGQIQLAAETLQAALEFNPEERSYRPETLRLTSMVLVRSGNMVEAKEHLREAKAEAISMDALWLERKIELSSRAFA